MLVQQFKLKKFTCKKVARLMALEKLISPLSLYFHSLL